MVKEDGTSTITQTYNGENQITGVEDSESGLRVLINPLGGVMVEARNSPIAANFRAEDVGSLHDLLGRMLTVLSTPATN